MSNTTFSWQTICALYFAIAIFGRTARAEEVNSQAVSALHLNEAVEYSMFLDDARTMPLELEKTPIFKWQNITNQGQLGSIFVWTRDGRPEVVGSMFSQAERGERVVTHEFHTLSDKVLTIGSPKNLLRQWKPRGRFSITPLEGAPDVAGSPAQRMIQMRGLSRDFSAYTKSNEGRIELRLATQPMIRYQPTRSDVLDGALFAFLSSAAGTDPEFILQIEARKSDPNSNEWHWAFGIIRFCDRDLVVLRKDAELYSSVSNASLKVRIEDDYLWTHNADDTYFVFRAKKIPELTKSAVKQ